MSNDNIYAVGYKEMKGDSRYKNEPELLGQGGMICKPYTPFTLGWFTDMNNIMDKNLEQLRRYTAKTHYQNRPMSYQLEWGSLFGHNFHRNVYKYSKNVEPILPHDFDGLPYV